MYIILLLLSHKYIYCLYTASASSDINFCCCLHTRVPTRNVCMIFVYFNIGCPFSSCAYQRRLSVINLYSYMQWLYMDIMGVHDIIIILYWLAQQL